MTAYEIWVTAANLMILILFAAVYDTMRERVARLRQEVKMLDNTCQFYRAMIDQKNIELSRYRR